MKVGVIVNPHAKKNRGRRDRAAELRSIFGDFAEVVSTVSVEDVGFHLERFHRSGVRYIVADGGDGTLHCVLNQAIERLGVDAATRDFVYMPSVNGTINYMAKAAGLSTDGLGNLRRLRALLHRGLEPSVVHLPTLRNTGFQEEASGRRVPWGCHSWSNAVGGFAARFHKRWYESHKGEGALRIVALFSEGLAGAALYTTLRGPLQRLRPSWVNEVADLYIPQMRGEVRVDGEPFRTPAGESLDEFSFVNAGAVPVDLAGVFKVFQQADAEAMHVHVGRMDARELPLAAVRGFRNRPFGTRRLYDGPAQTLEVICAPGTTLEPSLDGEIYVDLVEVKVERGPLVAFVKL